MIRRYVCTLSCLLLISGCGLSDNKREPIELTPREVLTKLQDGKENSFMLFLTTDDCYTCEEYNKVVKDIQEAMSFDIYYINLNMNEKDSEIKADLEELNVTIGDYQNLPTTYYFYQGNLLPENRRDGYIEKTEYMKWLKDLRILQ